MSKKFGFNGEWNVNELAYVDTFSGLVKVKIVGKVFNDNAVSPSARDEYRVVARVTDRSNKAYRTGETVSVLENKVIRRDAVFMRSGNYRIRAGMLKTADSLPMAYNA